jgi:AcrR family transcriptional regulator
MATTKKTSATKKITRQQIIDSYMHFVLENEKMPVSIYKFSKDNGFSEQDFYKHFGSFEALKSGIWTTFFEMTMNLAQKNKAYDDFSNQEKMLTFFYTFFELLTANRSYVLFSLNEEKDKLKTMQQLSPLRKKIKSFAAELIEEKNDEQQLKFLKQPAVIFSEGAWLQFVFILKFWMDDSSPSFEKTDVVIEKSVRAIFDVFATTPLESVIDFGKFIWKEKMA